MANLTDALRISPSLVSVGIVNWNSGDCLRRCLRSVAAQTYAPLEIIVVDNASTDGSADRAEAGFPQVRIVRNGENRGFARAQNQAIRLSRGAYYMPLNPDVELSPRFVEETVRALEKRPAFGYASGLVYFAAGDTGLEHVVYSSGHLFVRNFHAYNRFERVRRRPEEFEEGEVGGASGVCPLYRRSMLDDVAVGGEFFDESFFLYVEDVDLDWRAHLAGWRCWFTPHAQAWHVMEATGGADCARIRAQIAANRWLMILKNADLWMLARRLPFVVKFEMTRTLPLLARRPTSFLHLVRDFGRGLPRALRKRRLGKAKRRWSSRRILEWMGRNLAQLRWSNDLARRRGRYARRDGQLSTPAGR